METIKKSIILLIIYSITSGLFAQQKFVDTASQRISKFKDGERVVFLGNSITDGGHYHSYIWLYYMTRFPNRDVHFYNAGIRNT